MNFFGAGIRVKHRIGELAITKQKTIKKWWHDDKVRSEVKVRNLQSCQDVARGPGEEVW